MYWKSNIRLKSDYLKMWKKGVDLHNCKAVQNAIDTVQEIAGLEEQTIEYLLRYQYGEQLVKKLAEVMEK